MGPWLDLNQSVQNLAFTINGAPRIHQFAAYVHETLIQAPLIKCRRAALAEWRQHAA